MKVTLGAAILALTVTSAFAHRLDEYLQGTIVSVGKTRLQAQMMLTPGVAVFPAVMAAIDTDRSGAISEAERHVYAEKVLRDLSLTVDGHRLTPQLISIEFPAVGEMKEGRGEIELDFSADLPPGGRRRKLTIENHHESGISVYQVNCLVPSDPNIRIAAQKRNYTQSLYQLDYEQTDVVAESSISAWTGRLVWLSPLALILLTWLMLRWLPRAWNEGH